MSPVTSALLSLALVMAGPSLAHAADDLFRPNAFVGLAHDQRASQIGDSLTVLVYQSAEARNAARSTRGRTSSVDARGQVNGSSERAGLSFGGDFDGGGEVRRSETFITQISAVVVEVLPNSDVRIEGRQTMVVNGEETVIEVRGRVRVIDITADNQILSTQIADAEIRYDGDGFVSRSASPGWLHGVFNRLGLN